MSFQKNLLIIKSSQPIEIIDITDPIVAFVREAKLESGILHVASSHTTLGLILNEKCDNLQRDMKTFLESLAPADNNYLHDRVAVDGRANTHSHLLSMFLPSQLSLVLENGVLNLGSWQSIFAVELDGPREERKIQLTLMKNNQ